MLDDDDMPQIPLGSRVRLRGKSHVLQVRSPLGRVVRPDTRWDGYYIVRLDEPALYDNGVGLTYELREIREAADNLDVIKEP